MDLVHALGDIGGYGMAMPWLWHGYRCCGLWGSMGYGPTPFRNVKVLDKKNPSYSLHVPLYDSPLHFELFVPSAAWLQLAAAAHAPRTERCKERETWNMFRTYLEHTATMRAIQPLVIHFIDQSLPANDFNAYCICNFLCALPFGATWIVGNRWSSVIICYITYIWCILTKYIYIYTWLHPWN